MHIRRLNESYKDPQLKTIDDVFNHTPTFVDLVFDEGNLSSCRYVLANDVDESLRCKKRKHGCVVEFFSPSGMYATVVEYLINPKHIPKELVMPAKKKPAAKKPAAKKPAKKTAKKK